MTAAERRADVEWSRDVRAREGYRCQRCRRHAWAQAHPNESREVAAGLMGPNEYERLRALASGHVRRRDAVPARPPKSASRARPVEALSVEPF